MSVNYMLEIIGLDDWELTHPLPATAYKLMRKLQYLANKERFPERMNVSNGLLMSMVGCSEDSLIKARNQLIQAGLIQYKGQKKLTPLYMIQYFSNNPAYNSKKTGYEHGIKRGYEHGIAPDYEQGTYINNTPLNNTPYFDDDEQDQDERQGYARARARAESLFCYGDAELVELEKRRNELKMHAICSMEESFDRNATIAEADNIAQAAAMSDVSPEMLHIAIREAALAAASNPAAYVRTIFNDWQYEHVKTPAEYGEYRYMRDAAAGRTIGGASWEEMKEARERRKTAHGE